MAPLRDTPELKIGHIADVQELRRLRPWSVPARYVRDADERPASTVLSLSADVPIIDLTMLDLEGEDGDEMAKLVAACRDWGFFQVINHGVEAWLMEKMERVTKEFFMLPLEEKEKYHMLPGTIQGYGHAFIFSEDQKLDWCNMLALGVQPHSIRNPNLWPTSPPNFSEILGVYSASIQTLCRRLLEHVAESLGLRPAVFRKKCETIILTEILDAYSANIRTLCRRLLEHVAESLGLPPAAFDQMFADAVQAVRMNYYPPCPRPDLVLGLSPHSDGSAITVLQQQSGPVGLQFLKENSWAPVRPIKDALVINLGDTLEVLTNGKYKSVEHRVVTDEKMERLSVVTFYAPSYDVELGPLSEFVGDGRPCMYRRYNHGDYNRHYITNKLQGKKTLEFAKIHVNFN